MDVIAPSLIETLILVSLAIVIACVVAALGGFVRYTTRLPGNTIAVFWLMRMGIFVGIPFSIIGMISGYMTGSSRVGAISAIVSASLTFIGGVAAYLFTKGGKAAVMASFAVLNFAILMLIGVLIGAHERVRTEEITNSLDYQKKEIDKEFLLRRYRRGLGMDDAPKKEKKDD
jgi:O-antigen/teichoic acid export membrane protein